MNAELRSLNMAKSLLPSWDVVALIVARFEQLESLSLKCAPPFSSVSSSLIISLLSRLKARTASLVWIRHQPR